jgi:hypothetical protein
VATAGTGSLQFAASGHFKPGFHRLSGFHLRHR